MPFFPSAINPRANVLTPQEVWDSGVTYSTASYVYHQGGIWVANARNTDSEPASGNTDWTLISGIPYVEVVLSPVDLTTAPFYDPTETGPGIVIVPAPGEGLAVVPLWGFSRASDGDDWDSPAATVLTYGDATGTSAGAIPVLAALSDNLNGFNDDLLVWSGFTDQSSGLLVTAPPGVENQALVLYTTTDITGGGLTVGTRSLRYVVYYQIYDDSESSFSTFFHITGVNQGTKTLTVTPTPVSTIAPPEVISIVGSTGNNGTYTALNVTATTIQVKETLPSATGDGWVEAS